MRSIEDSKTFVEDASEREGWHGKGTDRLSASEVRRAWRKSTPVKQEGCIGNEPERLGASER